MPTTTVPITNKCSQLVVTTSGDIITTLKGRFTGSNISFIKYTYDDLKMRRKSQVLKYIPQQNITQHQSYSNIVNSKGYYSKAKLVALINAKSQTCPNVTSTSSCSGVIGSSAIYYLDPNVPYYPSI